MRRPFEINGAALRRLAKVKLVSFSASPQQIQLGQTSTLRWQVTGTSTGTEPKASVRLNDEGVSATGDKTVKPFYTRTYRLIARCLTVSRTLGQRTVQVDTSNAIHQDITEGDLASVLWPFIRTKIEDKNSTLPAGISISERREADVQIDATGVALGIRMEVSLPGFPNPDLNVDARIRLGFVDGETTAYYSKFSVDLDWPWYVTLGSVATLGTTGLALGEIATLVVEEFIYGDLKDDLLENFRDGVNFLIRSAGYEVIGLEMTSDKLVVTKIPG